MQIFMLPRASVAEHVRVEFCQRTFAPPCNLIGIRERNDFSLINYINKK